MWQMALEIKRDIFSKWHLTFTGLSTAYLPGTAKSKNFCSWNTSFTEALISVWGPVQQLATGCTVRVRIPWGQEIFLFSISVQTGPEAHPDSFTMGTRALPQGQSGRGVAFNTKLYLPPKLTIKKSIRPLPLCASYGILRGYLYLYLLSLAFLKTQEGSSNIRALNQQVN